MITIISSRTKEEGISNDVFITIYNECRAQIKVYTINDGRQCLCDIFDCSYVSFLTIQLPPGKYKLCAETYQGRKAERRFTKENGSQNVEITF